MRTGLKACLTLLMMLAAGCDQGPWNNPYPASESGKPIYYDMFSERPKHLDPITAYSSDEYQFIAQIYEPPLQYHFLKRPYELTPLTAKEVPEPVYYDEAGNRLPEDADAERVAKSVYLIEIQSGILYQPHPAFAVNEQGEYRYHDLEKADLAGIQRLSDFEHTGTRELTAADYVYQIKRLAHPRLHSPIAGLMSKHIVGLPELIEILQAHPGTMSDTRFLDLRDFGLDGVRVLDRYTYEITIRGKYPQFVYWLAMPFFAPMPWEAERFHNQPGMAERNIVLDWYPVGTGPFMLTENNPNLRMVMHRNPNFRGEPYPAEGMTGDREAGLLDDAGKAMPFIDKAVYSLENESIPAWNKFLQGYYDVSAISSDSFDQAVRFNAQGNAELTAEMKDKGIDLLSAVTTSTYYIGFNMLDPVVGGYDEKSRYLRQAISIAIDIEEFVSIFQNGRGLAAQGPIPPGIFGAREGEAGVNPYVYNWNGREPERKSIETARELLARAGYPNGRDRETGQPLTLYYDALDRGPDSKALNNWYIKQLNKLGIRLVIRSTDYNRFREKMRKGTAQIYFWGWNADYPDPENFLFLLYGPNGKAEYNGENSSNYANPEFDRLFEKMRNMDNGPARQELIDRMVEIARRDAPWLWGFHPVAFSLNHQWYQNAKPNLMANNTLKYKRIDGELRQDLRAQWNEPVIWPLVTLIVLIVIAFIPGIIVYRRRERSAAV
ncbi:MAG: ABC transporter substrate-binding protein [Gammaproteobacteria bacterium]|nr:ABC transporter substrate-binding protein [Gammaproteobacteria bacterium]